ncbi:MAG: class I SAM-dependent methyltransferase [Eubacteriales bacterium]|nr:class I SAM-dependent methyltransferase [Eubacteriales bacterium]MDD3350487.1 class I SAM-dependent methyltransferase [Eubacteriales bacterium]
MIKLSERLLLMAACVAPGETLADIGTDHGLLPIFLYENKVCPKMILCDIAAGPLEKAKQNIAAYAPSFTPELRQGDGLSALQPAEVDTVVIAGMGGELIADILAFDLAKTKSYRKFILQPRTAPEKLRKFLYRNDFTIQEEHLASERGRICEVIVAVPSQKANATMEEKEARLTALDKTLAWEISPLLIKKKDPYLERFLNKKIDKELAIIKHIEENGRDVGYLKAERTKKRIKTLRLILHKITKDSRKD